MNVEPVPDEQPHGPLEQLAEVCLFAPLGLALEARTLWPELVDRGRVQVSLALAVGHQTVGGSKGWFGRRIDDAKAEAEAALRGLGLLPPAAERPTVHEPPLRLVSDQAPAAVPSAVHTEPAADVPVVDVADLAIPDYDSLSASQVVPRLAGLSPAELELVGHYELGHRGRKTILNRVAQLQV